MTGLTRLRDVIGAVVLGVVTLPVTILVAGLVLASSGLPVLHRAVRAGVRGEPFRLIKFRTMRPGDATDAERLTRIGSFLRRTSLDELPELWNVLRGEMSLVGPRPLPMKYVDRYTPQQARRLEVKPGLTGWSQVKARNALEWEDKLALDVWYVEHRSFWLDLKILLMTVPAVLFGRGVSAPGHATMPEFKGTP